MLDGIRVVDLTRLLPGPYCTLLLADLGAEVIKIEPPGAGDPARQLLPGLFHFVNRNKKSVTLDLKSDEGRELFRRLAASADVIIEGFRPGVADRLGVGWPQARAVNPKVIYCSISGYGQTGPYRDRPGHDVNYLGVGGVLHIPGQIGQPAVRPGVPVADMAGGLYAALSVVAALLHRQRGGPGQFLDVALADAALCWAAARMGDFMLSGEAAPPEQMPHLNPTNDVFVAGDGRPFTVGALEEHFWKGLCRAIGREDLLAAERFTSHAGRRRHAADLAAILRAAFRGRSRDEWLAILERHGVPCAPVQGPEEVFADVHFRARGTVVEQPVPGGQKVFQVGYPVRFSAAEPPAPGLPPALGEHTAEVFTGLGVNRERLEEMRTRRVI